MSRSRPPFRQLRPLSMAVQVGHMRHHWPSFRRTGDDQRSTWRGLLQPTEVSGRYEITVTYRLRSIPRVWVREPTLALNAPHIYSDGTLCLYYPDEWQWHGQRLIARTIIPWAADWLFFYELWLDTGEWLGPEVAHDGDKEAA